MSWIIVAAIGGTALLGGSYLQYKGAEKQTDALEEAARGTKDWQNYLIALEERRYNDAKRFRDLAYREAETLVGTLERQIPLIEQDISEMPETAREYYALASERGTEDIMSSLSPFGLAKSSVSGKAVGTMQEGLSAIEAQDLIKQKQWQTSIRMGLIGRPTGINPSVGSGGNYISAASGAQQNLSNLTVGKGAVKGGLYGSYGSTLSQLGMMPLQYQMYKGLGWGGKTGKA